MVGPITYGLGGAIAKATFKAWFKDSEFAGSLSDSLTDLIARVIPDWKARSAATRQIERASERAAEALLPLIEREWSELDDGETYAAILSVQNAIESINVNSTLLASINYSHVTLHTLIESASKKQDLSNAAKQLSVRLCSECAQIIIDLAASLPEFQRESYAEILRRETLIAQSIDRLFEELENIRAQSLSQSTDRTSAEFEQNYRRAAVRRLDRIELFGLNAATRASTRQHSLSTAYISLSVSGAAQAQDVDASDGASALPNTITTPSGIVALRAEEAAAIAQRIVIKGDAGSGKTTLLQSLAVRCSLGSFEDARMKDWNNLVPFFISLRALVDVGLPPPEDFPKQVAPIISGTMPDGWVHELLAQGRCLLLIDGLDEISEVRREATRTWIGEILEAYPENRVLISSRPPAIPDGWLGSKGFVELELLPMSLGDVSNFVEHWHEAVAKEEREDEAAKATLSLSTALKERIKADRSLRELAATPLLCAMLCAMNRDRREVLPSNRIALYEAATQMILHGRDEQRQVRVEDLPSLDFETKRDLLQDIALWMMENGLSMAEDWRIEQQVQKLIPRFSRLPRGVTSASIVKALIHRSGVLRSPVDGQCDFIHNAFKEYLCARAVSDNDKFGFLIESIRDSEAWREVAPMAAAITDDRRRTAFLSELLGKGDMGTSKRAMYHLLAVRCLETCTQLDPAIQMQIRARLTRLKPPQSISEAKSLSAAGDLATDLARKRVGAPARTAACCVRTLRLIGSSKALDHLEAYGADGRSTVAKELLAAWPFFDRRDYARRVLSGSRALWGGLRLDSLAQLEGVGELINLASLTVLAPRSYLEEWHYTETVGACALKRLYLNVNGSVEIDRLVPLQDLETLIIDAAKVPGFEEVDQFQNLKTLNITATDISIQRSVNLAKLFNIVFSATRIEGLSKIAVSDNLIIFFAPYTIEADLSFLKSATSLTRLAIQSCHWSQALVNLVNLPKLTGLFLYGESGFRSIDELPSLKRLDSLWLLDSPYLESLSGIERFGRLKDLRISGAKSLRNLEELAGCQGINQLTIDGTPESLDLTPIAKLKGIRTISAPANVIARLRGMGVIANFRRHG